MRAHLPAAAVAVALLLSACGTQVAGSGGGGTSAPTPAPDPVAARCPDSVAEGFADYRAGIPLPDDAAPVAVLRCVVAQEDDPQTGRWTVVRTERATSGLAEYVAALRLPDQPKPDGDYACTADALLLPWSAVVLPDGSALQARLPVTACGKPLPEVMTALDRLGWRTVSTERVAQAATAAELALEREAAAVGCSYQFKDVVAIEAQDGADDGSRPLVTGSPRDLVACRYSADPASDDPVLTYVGGGRRLTPQEAAQALDALSGAAPTTEACVKRHTALWGLFGADGGAWVVVETDGCGRAASDSGALRTVPPASLAALETLLAG